MKKMKNYFIYVIVVLISILYISQNACIREYEETKIISQQNEGEINTEIKG